MYTPPAGSIEVNRKAHNGYVLLPIEEGGDRGLEMGSSTAVCPDPSYRAYAPVSVEREIGR